MGTRGWKMVASSVPFARLIPGHGRVMQRRLPAVAVALLALCPLVLGSCDWAQLRFGTSGTGFNPFEGGIGVANVSALRRRWSEQLSGAGSSPVVADGIVYTAAADGRLEAFDAHTATGKWSYPIARASATFASPTVLNGVVYAVDADTLYALDAVSGTKLWSRGAIGGGSPIYGVDLLSSPVVTDGVVYIGGLGIFSALNATTGDTLWSTGLPGGGATFSQPSVDNGVVYVGDTGNTDTLHAFDATTGAALWSAPAGNDGGISVSGSAVANGIVYVDSDKLYAFDATTGALLWSAATGNFEGVASPAIANGVVYQSGLDQKLYAYNATTGALLWSAIESYPGAAASPTVAGGVVYVDTGLGSLEAFSTTTGTRLWSSTDIGWPGSEAVVANGIVYAATNDHLYAYSLPVPGAGLTVSPTFAPNYGTVLDGTSSGPTTFTVTNFGSAASSAVTDTLAGHDPSQFRITTDSCRGVKLASRASCTIGVALAPTQGGAWTASLAISSTTGGTAMAKLSGSGNALTISPTVKDFGTALDGTRPSATTFTVTNRSVKTVGPTAVSLTGSQFAAGSDTCRGATLAAGATCRIAVAFRPTDIGVTSGRLAISAPGSAATASLSGTARGLAITPAAKNYGTVAIGSKSAASFTITNEHSAPLPVADDVSGSGFSITSDGCETTLAVGTSCTVTVTFAPTVRGSTYTGQLAILVPFVEIDQVALIGTGG